MLAAITAAPLALAAPAAHANEPTAVEQVGADIQTGAAVGEEKDKDAATKKKLNILVVPLPVVDPALGDGLTLVGALFYSPVAGGRQWVSGLGGLYTKNKDWALGVAQQADLMNGRLRLTGFGGYGDFKLKFFGIGQDAGAAGRSITLDEKGTAVLANVLYEVHGPIYLGLRYRFMQINSSIASPLRPDNPILPNPPELKSTAAGLGPSLEIDTRNSEFMPNKGLLVQGQWLVSGSGVGSDFSYNKLNLAGNLYHPLGRNTVLALRASLCDASHGAPFYDLCFFGSQHDLRGYEGGQYRDHAMIAAQAELRQHLFWRIGAVAFAGVGTVAHDFGSLGGAKPLPAGGLGLRFQPVKKIPVNISIDYAWGEHSSGLYLYVGEAF